ncbi:MAG: type I-U CRISPR-associated helicase/endonuclease Cas3 [Acidobacteria bacterium]|nr:MAG: type I-U CRISPR-associated helicase/endonuclease Cas3 [Acidobacteriota bacterium]
MVAPTPVPKPAPEFAPLFEALTGHHPYPWQQRLFDLLLLGEIPADIGLPTGSGKTSIMVVWLIAVTAGAPVPRRLVWVVDRRVVVDQATTEAEQLAIRISEASASPALRDFRDAVGGVSLTASEGELAISTLRGEKEDNRAWSKDPSRPAIIVGTVDMIGSRLLFSGYGDGRSRRASHAGLLGHDVLLINDEAHLTLAFASLIGKLAKMESNTARVKQLRIVRLSATHQSGHPCWPESLAEDQKQPEFHKIFKAPKHLGIVPAGKQHSKLLELATAPGLARILIFLRKPNEVREVAKTLTRKLGNKSERIICLTGTMRGFERDQLIRHPVFQEFGAARMPSQSCWLIATSAAEVGVNISSDRLITDLETADHLIQRSLKQS